MPSLQICHGSYENTAGFSPSICTLDNKIFASSGEILDLNHDNPKWEYYGNIIGDAVVVVKRKIFVFNNSSVHVYDVDQGIYADEISIIVKQGPRAHEFTQHKNIHPTKDLYHI